MTSITIADNTRAGDLSAFLLVWTLDLSAFPLDTTAIARLLSQAGAGAADTADGTPADANVETYKTALTRLGRNPNRYRISSDALLRRARKDGGLPTILPLVDLSNILSLRSGWPIGCYDTEKLQGAVTFRQGGEGELMATLGKGDMDIAKLPVLADDAGGFGSTVSDSVRCSITEVTTAPLFVMYGYGEPEAAGLQVLVTEICEAAGGRFGQPPRLIQG